TQNGEKQSPRQTVRRPSTAQHSISSRRLRMNGPGHNRTPCIQSRLCRGAARRQILTTYQARLFLGPATTPCVVGAIDASSLSLVEPADIAPLQMGSLRGG